MIRNDWSTLRKLMVLKGMTGKPAVEDTATGNPLVFTTDLAKPLRSMDIVFSPIQAGSGDPSPVNQRPIIPWDEVDILHFDENLLNINRVASQANQGITYDPIKQGSKTVAVHVTGQRTNNNPFYNLNYVNGTTVAIPAGKWKIKGGTSNVRLQVFYKDANNVEKIAGYDDGRGATVTIPSDATASWCRLLTVTDDPVDETIYPIIASENSPITEHSLLFPEPVYGGAADPIGGRVESQWAGFTATWGDGENATDMGSGITQKVFPMVDFLTTGAANNFCNVAPYQASESAAVHFYYSGSGSTNRKCRIFLPSDTPDTTEITVITKLQTPITFGGLDPVTIRTLAGTNTIWSDANGAIDLTYLKKK